MESFFGGGPFTGLGRLTVAAPRGENENWIRPWCLKKNLMFRICNFGIGLIKLNTVTKMKQLMSNQFIPFPQH